MRCSSEGWVCTGTFLFFLGLSATEITCTDHVALHKQPINEFKLDHQRRQQALRAYCPNIYTVPKGHCCFDGCVNACVVAEATGLHGLREAAGSDSLAANVHSALYNYFYK